MKLEQKISELCTFCDLKLFEMQYGDHDFSDLQREFFAGVRSIGVYESDIALAYVERYNILMRSFETLQ